MTAHPLDHLLTGCNRQAVVPETPSEPLFSVIVRTQGRRPRSLAEALISVLSQTYSHYELLVVVHGNDHLRRSMLDSLPDAARYGPHRVMNIEGGGRACPLNAGLDIARGDYVCFLDDDDLARTDWLETFASAASAAPGTIVRALTETQDWATDGGDEPVRATGPVNAPYPKKFDLLAHMSGNQTPICSIAVPRAAADRFSIRFDESLPVYEDWDFLMRLAMLVGVTSIDTATSLYRRLDRGNAHTAHDPETWHRTHFVVIDKLSAHPVLLPVGDARRLADGCFESGGGSRYQREIHDSRSELNTVRSALNAAQSELNTLTRSPPRWIRAFLARAVPALQRRVMSALRLRR